MSRINLSTGEVRPTIDLDALLEDVESQPVRTTPVHTQPVRTAISDTKFVAAKTVSLDTKPTEVPVSMDTTMTENFVSKDTKIGSAVVSKDTPTADNAVSKDTISSDASVSKDTDRVAYQREFRKRRYKTVSLDMRPDEVEHFKECTNAHGLSMTEFFRRAASAYIVSLDTPE